MPVYFVLFSYAKIPFFGSSVIENSATAGVSGVFQKTSVNRSFGFLEKRQPSFPSTARTAKAPGLSPAFPSSPVFSALCRRCSLNQRLHIPPQMAHSGVLGFEVLGVVLHGRRVTNRLTGPHTARCCAIRDLARFCSILRSCR